MRHLIKITALTLLELVLVGRARAIDNEGTVITLSCDGMLTPTYADNRPANPQPLQKAAVIADLNEQTVFFLGYTVPIESVDEASIKFGARQNIDYGFIVEISGNIDRSTNQVNATLVMLDPTQPRDPVTATIRYGMVCKPSSN